MPPWLLPAAAAGAGALSGLIGPSRSNVNNLFTPFASDFIRRMQGYLPTLMQSSTALQRQGMDAIGQYLRSGGLHQLLETGGMADIGPLVANLRGEMRRGLNEQVLDTNEAAARAGVLATSRSAVTGRLRRDSLSAFETAISDLYRTVFENAQNRKLEAGGLLGNLAQAGSQMAYYTMAPLWQAAGAGIPSVAEGPSFLQRVLGGASQGLQAYSILKGSGVFGGGSPGAGVGGAGGGVFPGSSSTVVPGAGVAVASGASGNPNAVPGWGGWNPFTMVPPSRGFMNPYPMGAGVRY